VAEPARRGRSRSRGRGSLADLTLLDLLPRAGRLGRELAVRLDLLRSLGMRHSWARLRDEMRDNAMPTDGRRMGYEGMWQDAADEIGATVTRISGGFLEFTKGDARVRVWNHIVPLDDGVALKLSLDKALVHRLLGEAGLPVPHHVEFDAADTQPAEELLARASGACVLKPVTSDGGSGTTTGVRTPQHLRRAILRASRLDSRLLIEEQAPGYAHRMLMLDGELLDVIRRLPPQVVGDGRTPVGKLIGAENERRMQHTAGYGRPQLLSIDLDCLFTLEASGLSLRSVIAAGERVQVKTAVSQNSPDENEGILHGEGAIAPALIAAARTAVDVLGVRLAVVEVVAPDMSRSLQEAGGIVLEVNCPPGLHYHYDIHDSERAVRVAVPILRRALKLD
jgi:cyanophycin synthetase